MAEGARRVSSRRFPAAALLVVALLAAYLPALRGGFVWDDDFYVTGNANLHGLDGLRRIWTEPGGGHVQYYPLTLTAFWVEHQVFGERPLGYHLVNVALHAGNALLFGAALLRLGLPGAGLAAALFALHPVHVESVAWITELKNTLSTGFYLAAVLSWIAFRRDLVGGDAESPSHGGGAAGPRLYALTLLFGACAMLAKTATLTLPASLLVLAWWKRGRLERGDFVQAAPLFLMAAAAAAVTLSVETGVQGTEGPLWVFTPAERLILAGRSFWFYLGKLLWPTGLSFVYPRWEIEARHLLFPIAAAAFLALGWCLRRRIGRGPLAALAFFAVSLLPNLGFVSFYFMRYSFVEDHLQYLASLGPLALVAAGAQGLWERLERAGGPGFRRVGFGLTTAVLVAVLGLLTYRQARAYRSPEALWRDTVAKNPGAWMAHANLGVLLADEGRAAEAVEHFRAQLALHPDADAHRNLALALQLAGRNGEAVPHYLEALRADPGDGKTQFNLGLALAREGRDAEAIPRYETAARLQPGDAEVFYNLGNALARQGRITEAVARYREALRVKPDHALARRNLERALAGAGTPAGEE